MLNPTAAHKPSFLQGILHPNNPFISKEENPPLVDKIKWVAEHCFFTLAIALTVIKWVAPVTISVLFPSPYLFWITAIALEVLAAIVGLRDVRALNKWGMVFSVNSVEKTIIPKLSQHAFFQVVRDLEVGKKDETVATSEFIIQFFKSIRQSGGCCFGEVYVLLKQLIQDPNKVTSSLILAASYEQVYAFQCLSYLESIANKLLVEFELEFVVMDSFKPQDSFQQDDLTQAIIQEYEAMLAKEGKANAEGIKSWLRGDFGTFKEMAPRFVFAVKIVTEARKEKEALYKERNQKIATADGKARYALALKYAESELEECNTLIQEARQNVQNSKTQLEQALIEVKSHIQTELGAQPTGQFTLELDLSSTQTPLKMLQEFQQHSVNGSLCALTWSLSGGQYLIDHVTWVQLSPFFRSYDPNDKVRYFKTAEDMLAYQLYRIQEINRSSTISCEVVHYHTS